MGLFDIFTTDNADAAAAAQRSGITAGYNKASDALSQGRDALTTHFTAGLLPFQQNFTTGAAGQQAYADATGANGPEGLARAKANFQNAPGYQGALDAANENVLRNHARTGDTRSGATNVDLSNVAQNLQNQQWQQYTTNLQPFLNTSAQAASGIGTLNSGLGTALNANYGSLADLGYSSETGKGNADANAALAGNAASGNFVNALMGIAGLGSSSIGGSALSGAGALIFSDARVKEDIEPVGEMFDGTNIYRYRYKGDPSERTHIGVMAQEIEAHNPDAVREFGGIKAVDYAKATEFAAGLAHMLEAA